MAIIYVLSCIRGRFYVGKTNNVAARFEQHRIGAGAAWTQRFSPVRVERTILVTSPFDEDRVTKELMAEHGIDKVRGGSYVTMELSSAQINLLRREIWSAQDRCWTCGEAGHFANRCTQKTIAPKNTVWQQFVDRWLLCCVHKEDVLLSSSVSVPSSVPSSVSVPSPVSVPSSVPSQRCSRCGRTSHMVDRCFAKTHLNGSALAQFRS